MNWLQYHLLVMTPEQLRRELDLRGLNTVRKAGAALNCSYSTISLWLSGKRPIPGLVDLAILAIPKQSRTVTKRRDRSAK